MTGWGLERDEAALTTVTNAELADGVMAGWHQIRVRSVERTSGRIFASLGSRLPSKVLDLGGSSDLLVERMRDMGHDVVGVDINEFNGARERTSAFLQADPSESIRADVGTGFEFVLATDVLEHLPRPGEPFEQIAGSCPSTARRSSGFHVWDTGIPFCGRC